MSTLGQQINQGLVNVYRRYDRYVIGAVCVLILVLGYVFFLSDRLTELRAEKLVDLKQKTDELEERRDYSNRLQAMINSYAATVTPNDVLFMERVMPNEPAVPELLALLSDAARQGGFGVEGFSYSDESPLPSDTSTTVPGVLRQATAGTPTVGEAANAQTLGRRLNLRLSLKARNTYPSLRQVLSVIESSDRLLDVNSLQFTLKSSDTPVVAGAGEASDESQYELSVTTVYLPLTTQ